MARLSVIATIILAFSSFSPAQYNGTKPTLGSQIQHYPQGLVLDLLLNENGGTLVNNLSLNGNTGTITGATWVPGKFGPCLSFDGNADAVTIGNMPVTTGVAGLTVGVWLTTTLANADAGARIILAKSGSGADSFDLLWATTENVNFRVWNAANTAVTGYFTDGLLNNQNEWHHFVGVYDGVNVMVYRDGIIGTAVAQTGLIQVSAKNVVIGSDSDLTAATSWNGLIDSLQIFNCALTAAEVNKLYYAPFERYEEERPELYYTAAAPPAEDFQVIVVSKAALPFVVPVVVGALGLVPWWIRRQRKAA